MKQSLILKGKTDHLNRMAVVVRISDRQDRTFKKTRLRITEEQFDRFTRGAPKQVEKEHYRTFLSLLNDPAGIDYTFNAYMINCLRQWDRTKKASTLLRLRLDGEAFSSFLGNKQLSAINVEILNRYKAHLFSKGLQGNTVWKHFKHLKTFINKAHREGIITLNPFAGFETVKYKNPQRLYLTKDQIAEIDKYCQDKNCPPRISFIGTWFLICCYTGLRVSDIQKFSKREHIKSGRIVLYTTKTNEVVSLPVLGRVRELLERVNYKAMDLSTEKYNEYLKSLATGCELPPITSHRARHTFAVRCAESGLSPEVTAKLMGITNLKTVAIYYRIGSTRMDSEYERLFD